MDSERTVISAGKGCQGHTSQCPVNIVESTELRMRRLRISAISYLNTAPLMWDFEHGEAGRQFEIAYTLPSSCARNLAEGTADIGIIPAAAYTQIPGLHVLPDVAIASRRAVRSILLVSKTPLEKVRTVALDTSSMTSVALTKVLFEKWLGGGRTFTPMAPNVDEMLAQCDAGLVIGDPALQIDRSRYHTLDLAEEWIRYTGKPFVFAFWAVRGEALREADPALDLAAAFRDSRDHGLQTENLNHDHARVGAASGIERVRCPQLSHREHPLRIRCGLSARLAVVLPLCSRARRLAGSTRIAVHASAPERSSHAVTRALTTVPIPSRSRLKRLNTQPMDASLHGHLTEMA